jgi:hypothetical protein
MEVKRAKISRSLKLEADINDRLMALCEHLGVNPNAYLLNEVGKAISRDEIALVAGNSTKDMMSGVMSMFGELAALEQNEKVIEE